jgi:hypothetical protein
MLVTAKVCIDVLAGAGAGFKNLTAALAYTNGRDA